MKLAPIVLKLRLANTTFGNNIAGAAELAKATRATLNNEQAFVIHLAETVTTNNLDGGISQKISETFGVIIALRNDTTQKDKTGLSAFDRVHDIRAEIFKAILGWQMPDSESLIIYSGGRVLELNRAWFWYQFEFSADQRIDDDDGIEMEDLPQFLKLYAQYILADGEKYDDIADIVNKPEKRLPADSSKVDAEQQIEE